MTRFRGVGVVVAIVACGTLRKPPEPDRRLGVSSTGTLFESSNGYQFAALPEPNAGVVRVTVRYPVGSIDDPPGKPGLAHLVEHLLYEVEIVRDGQKTSIGAQLGKIALWSNAYTASDYTSYEALVPPSALDELFQLEVDRLVVGCTGLTKDIVAREREVVLNELREHRGATGEAMSRQIREAVYPEGHPYRAVDTIDSVAKLQLEDVCGFLVGPYRRGKVVVIASGAVDGPKLQAAAGERIGHAPKRAMAATRAVPSVAPVNPGTVKLRGDVDRPMLIATWPLPPSHTRDYRLLEMAWRHMPGRLEAFGLTYGWGDSADYTILGGPHAPVLALTVTLRSAGDVDDARAAVGKSMEYALRFIRSAASDRGKRGWTVEWQSRVESLLARWESLGARNDLAADFMQYEPGDKMLVGRVAEMVESNPSTALALAEQWLAPDRARYLLIEPTATVVASRRTTYHGGSEAHGIAVDPALADRALPIPAQLPVLSSERYTLGNGLRVVLWPYGSSPLVHGRLVIGSGSSHEPAGQEGISAFVGADVDEDTMVFSDRQLATQVDDAVEALAGELRSPGYELADEVKAVLRGKLALARAKERTSYAKAYLAALYGSDHPYARTPMTEDTLDRISRDSVMKWARKHIVPNNAILVLAGKFDPALVKQHILYNTDMVSKGSRAPVQAQVARPRQAFIPGIAAKPSPTLELDLGFVGGHGIDNEHARRLVLAAVLDIQLAQLRERRALSYGFSASYSPRHGGGLWSINGDVDASRAGEAATAIVRILNDMRADPETYRTAFVLARQKVLENLLVNTTSSQGAVDELAYLARFDLPDDFYPGLARTVAGLTLADFHRFLAYELAATGQVFGAFGNADAVEAAITAAKTVPATDKPGLADPFR